MLVSPLADRLIWQEWDDIYIVYQPAAAATHVFNETTVLILKCLQQGPLSMEVLRHQTEAALGVSQDELAANDFEFATTRLEELGLVEFVDDPSTAQ
ncbi:HPr-rel-A system PqqD family peptide chaperone [Candidatus Accumulibacter sp. ACC003]|uniref:HPr-rel-A system PqqD family peptide chaperone n=1 Tax=Candidatus Accumulibacter sp. ACC003 TaxID=2823334 RepID=UPI0025C62603|nr:HPr-rel-A system PqqD family peptide chaperone [Candidatus Accumulibacter sp. ACC003]